MPSLSQSFLFALFTTTLALPTPQLAGEGAACNSILSQTDNGIGYGIKNAEQNLAKNIASIKGNGRRQLAGEGAACNSILSQTDNGVGFGIKNAEENLAKNIADIKGGKIPSVPSSGGGGGSGGGSAPPPPPPKGGPGGPGPKPHRRQLDKISDGFQDVSSAAGTGDVTKSLTGTLDQLDGTMTGGAADAGAQIGNLEESTLESIGKAVPKLRRQLDKISDGFQAMSNAAGTGDATEGITDGLDSLDGTMTSGAADAGASLAGTEEASLESIGKAVPKI